MSTRPFQRDRPNTDSHVTSVRAAIRPGPAGRVPLVGEPHAGLGCRQRQPAPVPAPRHPPPPAPLGLRHAGDQRAAHRGGGDRKARALRQAQHRAVLGARKLHIDEIEPVARAERHDGAGVIGELLHVGAGETPMPDEYRNNDRGPITDYMGGGENLDSKAFMLLHASAEAFLSALVLDGTLEQFPRLRGEVIELGALWVPLWLKRLDIAQQNFARTGPVLGTLKMKPSDYVRRQLKFTPHPTEPAGWIIEQGGAELFMFSSDYPHIEGGRNPIKRFEESMAGTSESAKERFYARNFDELMG